MRLLRVTTPSQLRAGCALVIAMAGAQRVAAQVHPTGLTTAPREYLDKIPAAFSPFGGDSLPRRVDLSPSLPPPGDQGQQGSCVAWTVAYALRSYQAHIREQSPIVIAPGAIDSARVFSPAFVYNQINNGRNGGTYFGDALNLLQDVGAVPLSQMGYDPMDFTSQPDSAALANAANYRLLSWKRVDYHDILEVKSQVNAGYPVMIGANVDDGFMHGGKDFVWRAASGQPRGAHAMLVVGYDDDRHAMRVINSWGTSWGDGGYYWLDYDFFPIAVHEAYVAKDRYTPAPARKVAPVPPPAMKVVVTPGRVVEPSHEVNVRPVTVPVAKVVIPTLRPPAPTAFDDAKVSIVRTRTGATDSVLGPGIRFDGLVSVAAGAPGLLQVVIQVYVDSAGHKGHFIRAATQRFAVGHVRAATGTSPFLIGTGSTTRGWVAFLPFSAMDLTQEPAGAVRIVAEPVLYVDRFGVKAGATTTSVCRCGR